MSPSERFQKLTCTEHLKGDLRRSSVRASLFTGIAGMADLGLRIGSTAVLARLLLPEHFGIVMMVTAVTGIADQLRELGLSTATVQKKDITHQQVSNLFWINLVAGLAITLVVCAASPLIGAYYHDPRLILITCTLAANFLLGGAMVQHQALLTRTLRLGSTAAIRLVSSTLSTGLAIALACKGFGYWSLIWREVSRNALVAAGMWICMPWLPSRPSRNSNVRELISFGAHLSLGNVFASLTSGFDRFLLGRFWGPIPVGIYRQAFNLVIVPTEQVLNPIYNVTQPGLSILQDQPEKYQKFYLKVVMLIACVTMPFSLFVAIYPRETVLILLGPKWIECAPVFMILGLGSFIRHVVGSSWFVLITRGKSKTYLALTVLQNIVFVLAMLMGVRWGIRGVAMADVVCTWVMFWPRLHYSFRGSPVTIGSFVKAISRPAAASAGMALALLAFRTLTPGWHHVVTFVTACAVAGISFLGCWLLLPGGRAELLSLFSDLQAALFRRKDARSSVAVAQPVA